MSKYSSKAKFIAALLFATILGGEVKSTSFEIEQAIFTSGSSETARFDRVKFEKDFNPLMVYRPNEYKVTLTHLLKENIQEIKSYNPTAAASTQLSETGVPIAPKIIHYVWLGGPLYKEYWANMKRVILTAKLNGY